jgi:hypothetical protein
MSAFVVPGTHKRNTTAGGGRMQRTQRQVRQALKGVQGFMNANDAVLGTVNATGARKRLDGVVRKLDTLGGDQDEIRYGRRGEQEQLRRLRHRLVKDWLSTMTLIGRGQKTIAELKGLRLPQNGIDTPRFVAAARAIVSAAADHAEVFIAEAFPPDFVQQVTIAIDEVESASLMYKSGKEQRMGATAGLKATVSEGLRNLRVIDSLVTPKLENDPVLLATWRAVVRAATAAGRSARGESEETEATPTVGSPAPVVATPLGQAA